MIRQRLKINTVYLTKKTLWPVDTNMYGNNFVPNRLVHKTLQPIFCHCVESIEQDANIFSGMTSCLLWQNGQNRAEKKMTRRMSKMFVVILIGGALAMAAAQSNLPESAPSGVIGAASKADQEAIARVLADQDRAWAAGDAEAYTARVLSAVSFTNVVGDYSVGKEPLLAQVRMIFSTIYKGSRTRTTLVHITKIGDDVAIVDTISQLKGFVQPAMASVVIDGATYSRLQQTMVKRGGGWWIASIHNVFIDPEFADKATLPK